MLFGDKCGHFEKLAKKITILMYNFSKYTYFARNEYKLFKAWDIISRRCKGYPENVLQASRDRVN